MSQSDSVIVACESASQSVSHSKCVFMSDSVVTAHQTVSPHFFLNCTILTISAFIYTVHYLHSVGMIIHVEPSGEAMQRGTKQHRGNEATQRGG